MRAFDYFWAGAILIAIGALVSHNFGGEGGPVPEFDLGPLRLSVFGVLAALDVLFGFYLVWRWCERFDLDWESLSLVLPWVVLIGYCISHLVSIAFYFPDQLTSIRALLDPRTQISSFGGMFGGGLAAVFFLKQRGLAVWRYADPLALGFVGGYVFGRAGCFAIHDHPGRETDFALAVDFGGVQRHDLGFYEMWLMLGLLIAILLLSRRQRPDGLVLAFAATAYAPIRFLFDYLRIDDPRYGDLTPGQWFAIPLLAIGLWGWARIGLGARARRRD